MSAGERDRAVDAGTRRAAGVVSAGERDPAVDAGTRRAAGVVSADERDRSVDAARAVAIVGVVAGHWLVTGLALGQDGALRQASPLAAMPTLAPVTWLLQALGLFFFAGGYAAARSGRHPMPSGRLLRPVAALLGAWSLALAVSAAVGVPTGTLLTIATLVASPLWFLVPYLALSAVTRPLVRLVDRAGPAVVAVPAIAAVAACDMGLVPGWVAVPAVWSVPWVLGVTLARGRLGGARAGLGLAAAGMLGMAFLLGVAGYPASAVGVPGDARSNLDPPSLVALALAAAQIGVLLLVRARLSRAPGRDPGGGRGRTGLWPAVAALNRAALPIYLKHQSVLILVAAAAALIGPAPGLLTAPDGPVWVAQRLAWLPVFAVVLAAVVGFRPARKASGGSGHGGGRHADRARAH
ncbi:MAG TPA: acyltransferase [Actinoplanes sp.]|nr:acyltransferase [Actinoplanes sp.]